ncbi:hypothetical protein CERZMDRAFT_92470 [Cercospora zeae-maydis SCOH1-5]|uniref:Pal1 cell morphology protein n=1 Tax=Cercospora zeae-maydis SCOH1-5 TaxID=717836 RepID=A0A6A6FWL9_9PEZI|nr:hypothetical protein CERZMDRAFT_92470 [Cercospora zeae-maydis SCOH1-5]
MSQAVSSKAAAAYLIDPLNAPEPSAETGPGTSFGSTFDPAQKANAPSIVQQPTGSSIGSNNPYRKSVGPRTPPGTSTRKTQSRSPRETFPAYRAEAFSDYASPRRHSSSNEKRHVPPAHDPTASPNRETRHRRRTSSLTARYPGDNSHQPLEIIRRDSKKAHRSPHLRKKHLPGPDTIDRLDPAISGRAYHHEGPYDAALLARNNSFEISPVAAVQHGNEETLKATPAENIRDALERHRPLDGVAQLPPGIPDRYGRVYRYEEGADLMHEDGPDGPGYKRWAGKEYHPDDLKGKGDEFELDRAMKKHTINENGIEMSDKKRDPINVSDGEPYADYASTRDADTGRNRSDSGGLRAGLKKRIGSLRKKNRVAS